jgi:signal transduction histidine kinase
MSAALSPLAAPSPAPGHRILVVDDNPAIHEDLRKVLGVTRGGDRGELLDLEHDILGAPSHERADIPPFVLTSAYQGQDALALTEAACAAGTPFAVAIVDVRMPPGWDGIETIERLWAVDPQLQIVLCTAYTDHSFADISRRIGNREGLFLLKKPFEIIEVQLMVAALARKRSSRADLTRKLEYLEEVAQRRARLVLNIRSQLASLTQSSTRDQESLLRTNLELVAQQQARDEMSGLLVHDLKNPLTTILCSIDLAADSLDDPRRHDDLRESFIDIRQSAERMLRLLGNLLAMNSAEAGKLQVQRSSFSLMALVQRILRPRRAQAERSGLRLEGLAHDLVCEADEDLLTRVIENIIDNGMRFTPGGGRLALSGCRTATGIELRIGNSGPAIPIAKRRAVFDKYGQNDAGSRMNFGLGLYFCRLAVEAHGGTIAIEETEALPTTFVLTLPGT